MNDLERFCEGLVICVIFWYFLLSFFLWKKKMFLVVLEERKMKSLTLDWSKNGESITREEKRRVWKKIEQ